MLGYWNRRTSRHSNRRISKQSIVWIFAVYVFNFNLSNLCISIFNYSSTSFSSIQLVRLATFKPISTPTNTQTTRFFKSTNDSSKISHDHSNIEKLRSQNPQTAEKSLSNLSSHDSPTNSHLETSNRPSTPKYPKPRAPTNVPFISYEVPLNTLLSSSYSSRHA